MLFNKRIINVILNFTLIFIIIYLIYYQDKLNYQNNQNNQNNIKYSLEPFNASNISYKCTMNLTDIDPRFVGEYMKYDGRKVNCGPCSGAILNVNIQTCPLDANGSPLTSCNQYANINCVRTDVNNISYPIKVTYPGMVNKSTINTFFCFDDIPNNIPKKTALQPTIQPTIQPILQPTL